LNQNENGECKTLNPPEFEKAFEMQAGYEIIDAHAHIFPEKISQKATDAIGDFYDLPMYCEGISEKLLDESFKAGISKCLVCSTATTPHQVRSINDFIAKECGKHPEFWGLGTLHPLMENLEDEVARIENLGLHGIKIHPDFQKFDIDCKEAFKIYSAIEGKLPILIHMGDERYEYSSPVKLARILKNFPRLNVIAAHFGGYRRWREAEEYLRHPNLKIDTSSSLAIIPAEYARKLIYHYGVENVFFGTDFPMWEPLAERDRFFALKLSFEENQKILAGNFKDFFGIE